MHKIRKDLEASSEDVSPVWKRNKHSKRSDSIGTPQFAQLVQNIKNYNLGTLWGSLTETSTSEDIPQCEVWWYSVEHIRNDQTSIHVKTQSNTHIQTHTLYLSLCLTHTDTLLHKKNDFPEDVACSFFKRKSAAEMKGSVWYSPCYGNQVTRFSGVEYWLIYHATPPLSSPEYWRIHWGAAWDPG